METITDDDLRQLRDALRGVLGAKNTTELVDRDWVPSWPALAELGLPAFCVLEERGGFGMRADAAVTAAYELGAALHAAPFAGLAATAHALANQQPIEASDLVDDLVNGVRTCAFGRLAANGKTAYSVDGAEAADAVLLVESAGGAMILFTEPTSWVAEATRMQFDLSRSCTDVTIDPSLGLRLPCPPSALALHGLLLAADAVGCVRHMLERTIAYAAQRRTFGRPIGSYQAVQHRLVDHSVRARGMSLLVDEAARLLATGSDDAVRHAAMAQLSVSSGALHILHDLLQLTGGIGFTWEYGLHLYERRVHHDARLAANPRAAVRILAEIEGWADAS